MKVVIIRRIAGICTISILGIWLCLSTSSCISNDKKEELLQLDSLASMARQASEILVIDDTMIAQRKDSIHMKIDFIKSHLKTKPSEQLESDMNILSGIASNYEHFLKDYSSEVYDNEEIKNSIDELRKDFIEGKINKKAFKAKYLIGKPNVVEHLNAAKKTVNLVLPIDNEYHRCSVSVNAAYKELAGGK